MKTAEQLERGAEGYVRRWGLWVWGPVENGIGGYNFAWEDGHGACVCGGHFKGNRAETVEYAIDELSIGTLDARKEWEPND